VEILTQNKMDKVAVKHVVYSLEQNTTQRIKKEVDGARVGRYISVSVHLYLA
jgi:hypothetical protein